MVKKCWEAGINFYDTAELYSNGLGEHTFGVALKELGVSRDQLVVSTKLFFGVAMKGDPAYNPKLNIIENQNGTSRKHLFEGMKLSLKNLQMDYVDIIYCHRYDCDTPVEEVCQAMKIILKKGMALYWGTSMWPATRLVEAMHICDRIGCPRPISEQSQYNLLVREDLEKNYIVLQDEYGMGNTIWSPVAQGLLSGKFNDGKNADSRIGQFNIIQGMYYGPYFGTPEKTEITVGKFKKFKA